MFYEKMVAPSRGLLANFNRIFKQIKNKFSKLGINFFCKTIEFMLLTVHSHHEVYIFGFNCLYIVIQTLNH